MILAVAVILVPIGAADDWGRDRAASAAIAVDDALDPAIRAAVLARSTPPAMSDEFGTPAVSEATGDGFAWGAAGIGAGVALAGVLLAAGCAMVVGQRHGGVRSA